MITRRAVLALPFAAACTSRKAGFRGYAFIANEEGHAVAAVDLGALAVAKLIPLDAAPVDVVALRTKPLVYALTPENGSIHEIQADHLRLSRKVAGGGAAALPFGATISPGEQWGGRGKPVLMGELIAGRDSNTSQRWLGAWANGGQGVMNRYLGLKFKIGNMFHYGWVRVTLTTTMTGHGSFTATITGYAYETIPGKAIRAGHTSGTAEPADAGIPADMQNVSVRAASLGMLALGSSGLSIWRREEITH